MIAFANDIVSRTARLLADRFSVAAFFGDGAFDDSAFWTVSARGRIVGSLVCEAGRWRLSWFAGADRRLVEYAGPVDGNVDTLADVLSARLGAPVRFELLAA